jgi:hypothetical protein
MLEYEIINETNHIGGVMVSVLASSVVDREFKPRSGQTKDYKIGICCCFSKHGTLRKKSKDMLARNPDNVSESSDMTTRGLLFQWASIIKTQLSVLIQYKADIIITSYRISEKLQQSLILKIPSQFWRMKDGDRIHNMIWYYGKKNHEYCLHRLFVYISLIQRHDISEILLKLAFNTNQSIFNTFLIYIFRAIKIHYFKRNITITQDKYK